MKVPLVICAMILAQGLTGQDPTIRTTVPLVVLPASVTDQRGASIGGLTDSDFVLLDDGKPKSIKIDVIDSGLAPIALVVLVQTNDISSSALGKIRKVGAVVSQSVVGENGEVAVVTFGYEVELVQDFTRDADKISTAFAGLKATDNQRARMLDAVNQALHILSSRPGSRRTNILVVGESKDRGSETKLADMTQMLQSSGVTVYALKYSAYWTAFTTKPEEYSPGSGGLLTGIGDLARLGKANTMEALTTLTGGVSASFETKSKLEKNLLLLSKDIHNRYLVSFVPDEASALTFHSVSIRIKDHPEAVVRTRPGYWTGF